MKLRSEQIRKIISIAKKSASLKDLKRTGWVLKGIDEPETVAAHTWRMALLVILLVPSNLDKEKLLEMCIVHDLGEASLGDIKWESGKKIISSQAAKHKDETKSFKEIFRGYKNSQKYLDLLAEFNEQKTPEARFLKQIDKLEMIIQALEYEEGGYGGNLLNEFWENAEKYLKGGELEPIFNQLKLDRKSIQQN